MFNSALALLLAHMLVTNDPVQMTGKSYGKQQVQELLARRPRPSYDSLIGQLKGNPDLSSLEWRDIGTLDYRFSKHGPRTYSLMMGVSKNLLSSKGVVVIQAGIHGDEVAGPLTLAKHLPMILRRVEALGLSLVVIPVANPYGFDNGLRYAVKANPKLGLSDVPDTGSAEIGNGHYVVFELAGGMIVDELTADQKPTRRYWVDDPKLHGKKLFRDPKLKWDISLPIEPAQETKAALNALRGLPLKKVVASIDLHQDPFLCSKDASGREIYKAQAYHYGYGDLRRYQEIVKKIETKVPVVRGVAIGSGYNYIGALPPPPADNMGFLVRYDSGFSDSLYREMIDSGKVPHAITVETTSVTDPKDAEFVNIVWIEGVLDLLQNGR